MAKPAMLVIRAGTAKAEYFRGLIHQAESFVAVSEFAHVPIANVFRSHDHSYELIEAQANALIAQYGGLVVLGYSIGAKFAGRLARDLPGVRIAFLLDPVDGGPPFLARLTQKWFPVFMREDHEDIRVPTLLIESELGAERGAMGARCVNPGLGGGHFGQRVVRTLLEYHLLDGAGHLDFLYPPYGPEMRLAQANCASGTVDSAITRARVEVLWSNFLAAYQHTFD